MAEPGKAVAEFDIPRPISADGYPLKKKNNCNNGHNNGKILDPCTRHIFQTGIGFSAWTQIAI